ncbi:PIG-L deacetylase family protein [Sinorhizobium meliloti]|jgi:LmbE family N-acetylglucosaminyl deacetylase|uniref:PIG-L deacetylase family protein n=1 Tax=Rhizobium meliloti TaxID=382 RepID=UPI00037E777A|nr:PIG-L family deacetylase [Sinorhizobium meliloti]
MKNLLTKTVCLTQAISATMHVQCRANNTGERMMDTHTWDVRQALCRILDSRMRRRFKPFDVADWSASSVIFAPHPDDETLGCGGVSAKKLAAGVEVRFVFVTDGAASHRRLISPEELRSRRESEALEAVHRLGASSESVTFLRFPDAEASHHIHAITKAIVPLLERWRPQSVFVTHAKDPPSDHIAVNAAVRAALRWHGRPLTVFEYPVWYWYHWPWVRPAGDLPGMWRTTLRQTVKTVAGLRALSALNTLVPIGEFLDVKRHALAAHVSQTQRPEDKDDWQTLSDLSSGEFVARLLADHEVFTRYRVNF